MRFIDILSSALLCSSVASAWSLDDNALAEVFGDIALKYKRDPQAVTLGDSNAATPNPTQSPTSQASASNTKSGDSSSNTDSKQSGSSSGKASGSGSGSSSGSKTSGSDSKSSGKASATTFDPRLPAGGISMIIPNPTSSTQYYKIGDWVTFAWNYTSLSVTPTAIDILATCTKNQATYTLALNQTIGSASTGSFLWDTKNYQASASPGLLTEKYTLIIHDANKSVSATPSAGYLATWNQFTFGMYIPMSPTPLDQFVCVTCSGAMSTIERQSMAVVGVMATFAVLGATWFTGGFGALL